jgi:hypothetical protein
VKAAYACSPVVGGHAYALLHGGELGTFFPGQVNADFDKAVFAPGAHHRISTTASQQ